jgi:hypothetical protein
MRLRAAVRFSEVVCRLAMVEPKRFCTAPRSARMLVTCDRAPSSTAIAALAPSTVEMSTSFSALSAGLALARPAKARSAPPNVKFAAELSVSVPRVVRPAAV